jgi:hypothetical protein
MPRAGQSTSPGFNYFFLLLALSSRTLSLEALAAINRPAARWLKWNFCLFAALSARRREHLTRSPTSASATATVSAASTPTTAAAPAISATSPATTTAASTISTASAPAVPAFAVPAGLRSLPGIPASLTAFGFVRESLLRKALLFVSGKSEFRTAIDANDGLVLVRHTFSREY